MNWPLIGAVIMALGVIFGAFGAHALRDQLDAYRMSVYEKAVFYHFVQGLGFLMVSFLPKTGTFSEYATSWVCGLLLVGLVIFCGSLYLLALTGNRMLGAITPIGGVAFIAGWLVLAWFLMRR